MRSEAALTELTEERRLGLRTECDSQYSGDGGARTSIIAGAKRGLISHSNRTYKVYVRNCQIS